MRSVKGVCVCACWCSFIEGGRVGGWEFLRMEGGKVEQKVGRRLERVLEMRGLNGEERKKLRRRGVVRWGMLVLGYGGA